MTLKEHRKHSDLARPVYGNFGRIEWSILGTHCAAIKSLADAVIQGLAPKYRSSYVDASHAGEGTEEMLPGRLKAGAAAEYTKQSGYHQFHLQTPINAFGFRQFFSGTDLVLVNGNHFEAGAQVIVIDPAKRGSLLKRMPQVNNLQMILLADGAAEVFDFVREAHPDWEQVPLYRIGETDKVAGFFEKALERSAPKLHGLVLAGGKSLRMGVDKGKIDWLGKEQRYQLADTLGNCCEEVFISCRGEQESDIDGRYRVLPDSFTGLGPFGAMLSAFRQYPDAAWLVTACDMPLLDADIFAYLYANRNRSAIATCFESPSDGLPEPLITIWEPKSYPVLLAFLAQGYSCPRKVLLNNGIHLLQPPAPEALMNVNTVEEAEKARDILNKRPGINKSTAG